MAANNNGDLSFPMPKNIDYAIREILDFEDDDATDKDLNSLEKAMNDEQPLETLDQANLHFENFNISDESVAALNRGDLKENSSTDLFEIGIREHLSCSDGSETSIELKMDQMAICEACVEKEVQAKALKIVESDVITVHQEEIHKNE